MLSGCLSVCEYLCIYAVSSSRNQLADRRSAEGIIIASLNFDGYYSWKYPMFYYSFIVPYCVVMTRPEPDPSLIHRSEKAFLNMYCTEGLQHHDVVHPAVTICDCDSPVSCPCHALVMPSSSIQLTLRIYPSYDLRHPSRKGDGGDDRREDSG